MPAAQFIKATLTNLIGAIRMFFVLLRNYDMSRVCYCWREGLRVILSHTFTNSKTYSKRMGFLHYCWYPQHVG